MKIHEFQAKETLKKFGVPVQDGIAIKSMLEFDDAIAKLQQRGINQFVVKSQIHAGGRGKVPFTMLKRTCSSEGGLSFTTSPEKCRVR
jgi:succinyl-CoA synthetase beta subunit